MKERGKHKTKPKFRDRQTAWWQPVEGMQQRVTVLRRNPDGTYLITTGTLADVPVRELTDAD